MSNCLCHSHSPQPGAAIFSNDAGDYIIDLMPNSLRESGRRVRAELVAKDKLSDLMYVARKCRTLVAEEQKQPKPQPTLVAAGEVENIALAALSYATGMQLIEASRMGTPGLAGIGGGKADGIKMCKTNNCLHKDKVCWMHPSYAGPLPVHLHLNEARRRGVEDGKAYNAKTNQMPLVRLRAPPNEGHHRQVQEKAS